MPDKKKKAARQSDWLKLMLEGQLTRDRVLRTKSEIEEDERRTEELDSIRRALHRRTDGTDQT